MCDSQSSVLLPISPGFNSLFLEHLNLASCPLILWLCLLSEGGGLVPMSSVLLQEQRLAGLCPFVLPVPVFPHILGPSLPLFFFNFLFFSFPCSPLLSGITGCTGGGRKGNAGNVAR